MIEPKNLSNSDRLSVNARLLEAALQCSDVSVIAITPRPASGINNEHIQISVTWWAFNKLEAFVAGLNLPDVKFSQTNPKERLDGASLTGSVASPEVSRTLALFVLKASGVELADTAKPNARGWSSDHLTGYPFSALTA